MTKITPHDILKDVKELIKNKENWTRNVQARAADDRVVGAENDKACKFCIAGALSKVQLKKGLALDDEAAEDSWKLLTNAAHSKYRYNSVVDLNDDFGFEAVHAVLDIAIEKSKN